MRNEYRVAHPLQLHRKGWVIERSSTAFTPHSHPLRYHRTSMTLQEKSALLHTTLASLGSVLVAYSGGTDSAYLAHTAHQAF